MLKKVLDSDQSTSEVFTTLGGIHFLLLANYTGSEEWQLEIRNPDDPTDWIPDEATFSGNGAKVWYASADVYYRITGGDQGAKAWIGTLQPKPGVSEL